MKVHIVLYVMQGVLEGPEVFLDHMKADARYDKLCRENDLDPGNPHTDDEDVFQYEVEAQE